MVHPSKVKKAAAKPAKKASTASSASTGSSTTEPQIPQEDPVARGEELREKANTVGTELRDAFWRNLAAASAEPAVAISEEEKKKLPKGITLKTEAETNASIEKANALFKDAKYEEVITELNAAIYHAYLEEELLGQLYQIRGKAQFHQKKYFDAIRDLSFANHLFFTGEGETLFYRMRSYIELDLALYATLDYASLTENYSDFPDLKSYKSKVTAPLAHELKKLTSKFSPGRPFILPMTTPLVDLVKVTIVLALQHNFGYEELGGFLYMIKTTGYNALATPAMFGQYLRDVFSANDMDDVSEVFTHFIPEHSVPIECNINEVMDAVDVMGAGCHLIHRIGYAMCWSLAWTPSSMWNLLAVLFKDHFAARFDFQRALWHEYQLEIMQRVKDGDDDVSYFCNGGIGEIPPPHGRIDYLYVADNGASDYIRLHAEATVLKDEDTLKELAAHVPLNTFYVTMAPMIFAAARDAMPKSIRFMIARGAELNIMDAAEETPLDASRVALEFRMEMLHDHGAIVPIEDFAEVEEILKGSGARSHEHGDHDHDHHAHTAFEQMFGGAGRSRGNDEDDDAGEDEEEEYPYEDDEEGEGLDPSDFGSFQDYLRAAAMAQGFDGNFDGEEDEEMPELDEDEDEE